MASSQKDALVVDIETVTPDFYELDPEIRKYLIKRESDRRTLEDKTAEESAAEKMFLAPGLSRIVCIGMYRTDKNCGLLLQEGKLGGKYKSKDNYMVLSGDEKFILDEFWKRIASAKSEGLRFVTFYGERYDVPVILTRSAMLGVKSTANILASKFAKWSSFHLDLDHILTSRGAMGHYSLDYWCRMFDVPSPKETLSGSGVQQAYKDGLIHTIGSYCMRDTYATMQIYNTLSRTTLPHYFD